MKRQLHCICYALVILNVIIACHKDEPAATSYNTVPPPPPPVTVATCDNNRPKTSGQLLPIGKLSQPRWGMAVVAAGSKIFFAGGGIETGSTSRVDIYDIAANTWSRAELSRPRNSIAAVATGNKVFFAGGYESNGGLTYKTIDIYDLSTNAWAVAQLSAARSYIAAAAVGNKVFFAGGEDDNGISSRVIDIYDLSTGAWTVTQLDEAWSNMSAVSLHNKIYFVGGFRSVNGWDYEQSNLITIYDYATNAWSTDRLRYPMGAITGVAVADHIVWAAECFVEIKDVQTGGSSPAFLSSSAYWIGVDGQRAVVKENKVIFFRHNSDRTNLFDIYDMATQNWSVGELPIKVALASIISVNDVIYLAGGSKDDALTDQVWKLEY